MNNKAREHTRIDIFFQRTRDRAKRRVGMFFDKPYEHLPNNFATRCTSYFCHVGSANFFALNAGEYFLQNRERVAEGAFGEERDKFRPRALDSKAFALGDIDDNLRQYFARRLSEDMDL